MPIPVAHVATGGTLSSNSISIRKQITLLQVMAHYIVKSGNIRYNTFEQGERKNIIKV